MAKFKIKEITASCGMTLELDGKWVRADRGMVLDNINISLAKDEKELQDVTAKEIREAFAKAQNMLESELVKALGEQVKKNKR